MTVGNMDGNTLPDRPGKLPPGSTLMTEELHIAQALELCRSVMQDKN